MFFLSPSTLSSPGPTAARRYDGLPIWPQCEGNLGERLSAAGIASGIHYPIAIHLQPALKHLGLSEGAFPGAEQIARTTFSLPMYPELPTDAPERVAKAIAGVPSGADS